MYSGPVAANGFYKIALGGKPDTIIILGPNHQGFGENVSIMAEGKWKTPLGELEIDAEMAEDILKKSKIIKNDKKAHQYEHSIEVQLPFIQFIFGKDIKFVPICMTRQDIDTDIEIAKSICSSVVDKNILIIASSDFTHYEPQEYAKDIDKQAINTILEFNPKKLYDMIYHQNLTMCGPGPITVMLIACETLGVKKAELLKYATSGDVSGMYDQVVGYASLIVSK
jgi:AmmeMemoRadiSam system protein B